MTFENIHFVVNPAAGHPKPIIHTLNEILHPLDIEWNLSITQGDGSGKQQARKAVNAGVDLIVAYGGDGTVKDVMNGLIGSDVPLAVLHGGTGNALAYELGIPADLKQATALIAEEHRLRSVDVGKVAGGDHSAEPGYFMLRAGIGLQTSILAAATRELKDRFGNMAYVMASLRSLADSEPVTFDLTIDGEEVSVQGLLCMITNSASIGGPRSFRFAADVDPCDGALDVFVLDTRFESILNRLVEVDGTPFVQQWKSHDKITVRTPSPLSVALDGEEFGQTPITVSVVPDSVKVLVPVPDSQAE